MTFCVLDASAAMSMVIMDESTEASRKLSDNITRDGALVPSIFHLEIGNSLMMAGRRKRMGAEERARAFGALEKLEIEIDRSTGKAAWRETLRLADSHGLTLYDASYLELALRSDLPLATFDADLIRAAVPAGAKLLKW